MKARKDAGYDRGIPFFGEKVFCMTGLLIPKIVGNRPFFCAMILVAYLRVHGIFSSGSNFLHFSPNQVFEEVLSSESEG